MDETVRRRPTQRPEGSNLKTSQDISRDAQTLTRTERRQNESQIPTKHKQHDSWPPAAHLRVSCFVLNPVLNPFFLRCGCVPGKYGALLALLGKRPAKTSSFLRLPIEITHRDYQSLPQRHYPSVRYFGIYRKRRRIYSRPTESEGFRVAKLSSIHINVSSLYICVL